MTSPSRPVSLVAERAVRYLRSQNGPVDSLRMAHEVLSTRAADEATARRVLDAAFGGDPRLLCGVSGWTLAADVAETTPPAADPDPDRALVFLEGERPGPGQPFLLRRVSVLRLSADSVVGACGGDATPDPSSLDLRAAILENLHDAMVIVHDPPGSLAALERWLEAPLGETISLRRLAQARLGLGAAHDLETLAGRLGLHWRETEDPVDQAETFDACLAALRRPGETLADLRIAAARRTPPLDWSRFAFDRSFLRAVPRVPGTYRFHDSAGALIYVGKSKDLNARIGSYFRESGKRAPRVQALLDRLHRIEVEPSGSELEAMLREAEQIRREHPEKNIQRGLHVKEGRSARLRSILILEPAESPAVLRAFLIHRGRLVARVAIGARGGGLKRIARVLDDQFFFVPEGPTPVAGPDLDVELVVRWLAGHRSQAVAFDPTTLRSSREVIERLRWFLGRGTPFDSDGEPILPR